MLRTLVGLGRFLSCHAVQKRLTEVGIDTMVYCPVHRLPVYAGVMSPELPLTEEAAGEVLSLPIWPQISQTVQERVAASLQQALP